MTISHVQGVGENSGPSATFANPIGIGNMVCVVYAFGSGTLSSITDDQGNSYTTVQSGAPALSASLGIAYAINITNQPKTITMNGAGGFTFPNLIIDEFSGIGAYDTSTSQTTTTNSASIPSGNITPAQNGELLYAAGWAKNSGSASIGSSWSTLENNVYGNEISAFQVLATAGPVGASFTPSNGSDVGWAGIAAFTPAGIAVTGDALVAAESAATYQAGAFALSGEWLGRVLGGAGEPFEGIVRAQPTAASASCEAMASQREDGVLAAEALSTSEPGIVSPLEWRGDLLVVSETFWPLATTGRLLAVLASLLESNTGATVPVSNNSNLMPEILGSAIGDTRIISEQSHNAGVGVRLSTGLLTDAAAQLDLPNEALGQAITFLEAFLAIEVSSRYSAEAALAGECLLAAQVDDTAAAELWTTTLPQMAPGRLLTSPGRRRLLVGRVSE